MDESENTVPKLHKHRKILKSSKTEDTDIPTTGTDFDKHIASILPIINKGFNKRNRKERGDLFEFFKLTNVAKNFKQDLLYGSTDIDKLFYFISQFMTVVVFPERTVVYFEGDTSEYIYLLLSGKIGLYKLGYRDMTFLPIDYYKYLGNLHKTSMTEEQKFLGKHTIDINKNDFPVFSDATGSFLENILFKIRILQWAYHGDLESINVFLINNHLDPTLIGFDKVLSSDYTIEEYYQDQITQMTEEESFYVKSISSVAKKAKIAIFIPSREIKPREYYGHYKLGDYNHRRTETSIADEKSGCIAINKRKYSECILNEQNQLREKEIDFGYQCSFFSSLRKNYFVENFFLRCDIGELSKGTMLYSEGEDGTDFYIIKEGKVEIYLKNKSIIDMRNGIAYVQSLDPSLRSDGTEEVIDLKNSVFTLTPLLKKKKNYNLFVVDSNTIGLWEYVGNHSKAGYSVQVLTDGAKGYKLPYSLISKIDTDDFSFLKKAIRLDSITKISSFLKRLIMMKNSVGKKIDNDLTKQLKEEEERYLSQNGVLSLNDSAHIIRNEKKNDMNSVNTNSCFKGLRNNLNIDEDEATGARKGMKNFTKITNDGQRKGEHSINISEEIKPLRVLGTRMADTNMKQEIKDGMKSLNSVNDVSRVNTGSASKREKGTNKDKDKEKDKNKYTKINTRNKNSKSINLNDIFEVKVKRLTTELQKDKEENENKYINLYSNNLTLTEPLVGPKINVLKPTMLKEKDQKCTKKKINRISNNIRNKSTSPGKEGVNKSSIENVVLRLSLKDVNKKVDKEKEKEKRGNYLAVKELYRQQGCVSMKMAGYKK